MTVEERGRYSPDLSGLEQWMKYFQVRDDDAGKERMLSARRLQQPSYKVPNDRPDLPLRELHAWFYLLPALERHPSGQLAVPQSQTEGTRHQSPHRLLRRPSCLASLSDAVNASPLRTSDSHQPLMVYYGNACIGYVCWGARPGDVVASFNPGRIDHAEIHLALRQICATTDSPVRTYYEIVGQAVMATNAILSGVVIGMRTFGNNQSNLSIEDWAVLWYQAGPLVRDSELTERLTNHAASAGRLFTSVSDLSKSGPRIFMTQAYEDS